MTTRCTRRLPIVLWLVSLSVMGLSLLVGSSTAALYDFWIESSTNATIYATVGLLILTRHPGHRVGWLFIVIGVLSAIQLGTGQYTVVALTMRSDTLPGGAIAAWIASQLPAVIILLFLFLLLLFPTGQLPSRRWRVMAWATGLAIGLALLTTVFTPGPLGSFPTIDNPFGNTQIARAIARIDSIIEPVLLFVVLGAIVALIVRLRYAQGMEYQQLKWFVYLTVLIIITWLAASILLPQVMRGVLANFAWAAAGAAPAIGAAVAILRYRLYDIDLIINRTLVYGTLTVLLVLVYIGGVVGLQRVFQVFTGEAQSDLITVVSTLAIAALFQPLRRRIQTAIDRRFYRRKYDAQKTLAAFSMKLRDETDLDALSNDLLVVVQETLQPAHISLWLREGNLSLMGQQSEER